MISILAEEIRRVFRLSKPTSVLERIDFDELRKFYNAQMHYLRSHPLKEFYNKIRGLIIIGPSTQEPFKVDYFNLRAKGVYWSLC